MLKSVVLCVLVWHGMCEFSSRAHPYSTDTEFANLTAPASPSINDTDVEIEPKVNYNFITIFYVNGSFFGTTASSTASTTASTSASTTASTSASTTASTSASTSASILASTIASREGYIVTNGIGAHRVYTTPLTWTQARQICIEDGGDLAVIRSDAEETVIKEMVTDYGVSIPWIGFHSSPGKQHTVCLFSDSTYPGEWFSWVGRNPRRSGGDYHVYNNYGTLMDGDGCFTTRPFICKITAI